MFWKQIFFFLPTLIYKTYCPTMFGAEKETSFTFCVSWLNSNNQVLMICKFFLSQRRPDAAQHCTCF